MRDSSKLFHYVWDDSSFFAIYDNRYSHEKGYSAKLILTWPGEPRTDDEELVKRAIERMNKWSNWDIVRVVESYTDNGTLSHYDILNTMTGEKAFGVI